MLYDFLDTIIFDSDDELLPSCYIVSNGNLHLIYSMFHNKYNIIELKDPVRYGFYRKDDNDRGSHKDIETLENLKEDSILVFNNNFDDFMSSNDYKRVDILRTKITEFLYNKKVSVVILSKKEIELPKIWLKHMIKFKIEY
jgi:hypothetical protein